MATSDHPFLHTFRYMICFCLFGGYVHPNIKEVLRLPKPLQRMLPFLVAPITCTLTWLLCDVTASLILRLLDGKFHIMLSFQHAILLVTSIIALQHVSVIFFNRKTINAFVHDFNEMILRVVMDEKKLKIMQDESRRLDTRMGLHLITICSSPLILHTHFYMQNHRAPLISSLPWPAQPYLFVSFLTYAYCLNLTMAAYYYLRMGSLAVLSGQLQILKIELHEIFSTIYVDSEGDTRIRDFNSQEEDEIFHVKRDSGRLLSMDRRLNDWIQRHSNIFKFCRNLNGMFSVALMLDYVFSAVQMTTLIIFSGTMKGTYPLSLSVTPVIFMATLYVNCDYGERFTQASEEVTGDAYGCDWFAYPVQIQKKLLIIMQVSQQRPMTHSAFGFYPLNRETYYAVLNLSYTLLTFVQSMV